jgi:protein-tyrosine-phosphatase
MTERIAGLRFRLLGPGKSHRKASSTANILFICQGNICRSPYAEHKLRAMLAENKVSVASAGMLPRNHRPSPSHAIEVAGERGIDLTLHRSQTATDEMITSADLILVFDRINEHSLYSRHPQARTKTRWLDIGSEIDDPDGKDVAAFNRTYQCIDKCLHELKAELTGTGNFHA